LRDRRDDFAVLVVGAGPAEPALRARVAEAGLARHVRFLGFRENPFPVIRAARALLLTSRYESFGMVLLEAMACGTPVVAMDCPYGPREVLDGGRYGVLAPAADAGAFADAIFKLVEDPARRADYSRNGVLRAQAYSLSGIARRWEALFEDDARWKARHA
jgi:glycosyltransferase involved in cell wall biosynthesis